MGDSEKLTKEMKAIQRAAKKIGRTKKSARAFLLKHGFITKDNKLGKLYR